MHAAAGFPVESTWMQALKAGNYVTWPRLIPPKVQKHFPESDKVQKGHMKQQCQNVQSTKIKFELDSEPVPDLGKHDDETISDLRTHAATSNITANPDTVQKIATKKPKITDVFVRIINADNTMYTDQPGCFPATSSNGNKYIMVLVEIEGNYIDAEPMRSETEGATIKAYLIL